MAHTWLGQIREYAPLNGRKRMQNIHKVKTLGSLKELCHEIQPN